MKTNTLAPSPKLKLICQMTRDAWDEALKFPARFAASREAPVVASTESIAKAAENDLAGKGIGASPSHARSEADPPSTGAERVGNSEPTVPEFATRFDPPTGINIPSVPKLVLFLAATSFRLQPLRVVRRKSSHGTWFEVECYHAGADAWIVCHACAREEEAIEVAKDRGRDPAEVRAEEAAAQETTGDAVQRDSVRRKRGRPSHREQPTLTADTHSA
jgi:hypothetical protein